MPICFLAFIFKKTHVPLDVLPPCRNSGYILLSSLMRKLCTNDIPSNVHTSVTSLRIGLVGVVRGPHVQS